MIVRPLVFTVGFGLGAVAQAAAQFSTPIPIKPIPAITDSPTPAGMTPTPMPTFPPTTPTPGPTIAPPSPTVTPAQTATPLFTPTGAPNFTASPSPTPLGAATASPTPLPTSTPLATSPYKYVVDPPPDPNAAPGAPQIMRIEVNDKVIHVGGQIALRITTTPNVTNVFIEVEGRKIAIPKAQDGIFAGIQAIPGFIPPWFLKTYEVTFNAVVPDGRRASATIPITLAY